MVILGAHTVKLIGYYNVPKWDAYLPAPWEQGSLVSRPICENRGKGPGHTWQPSGGCRDNSLDLKYYESHSSI